MAQWLREVSVGEWYEAGGDPFEIVGVDADSEVVLVQHFDGSLEEVDFDAWLELKARPCAAPEDFSGALDLEREDYGFDASDVLHPPRRDGVLDRLAGRLDD